MICVIPNYDCKNNYRSDKQWLRWLGRILRLFSESLKIQESIQIITVRLLNMVLDYYTSRVTGQAQTYLTPSFVRTYVTNSEEGSNNVTGISLCYLHIIRLIAVALSSSGHLPECNRIIYLLLILFVLPVNL